MTTASHNTVSGRWPASVLRRVVRDLAVGLVAVLAMASVTRWLLALADVYLLQSVALYGLLAALVLRYGPDDLSEVGLGTANRVTLGRASLVLPVSTLAVPPTLITDAICWWIIAVSTVAMILDGVDGWIARRTQTGTNFGSRFDMELDAFLMLALSVLVWRSTQVGPWVLLIGSLRYVFVAGGWVWPALQAALPPSRRRKTICVVQSVMLLVCLGPIIPGALASSAAAGALAILVYSFAVDTRWLLAGR